MPLKLLIRAAIWAAADMAIYACRYSTITATTPDQDFHLIMGIVGIIFIGILTMMDDLTEAKGNSPIPVSIEMTRFISILGLAACFAILLVDARTIVMR